MRSIVYRNTENIAFLAVPPPLKQKPLIHWLFAPFYTVLSPLFCCHLPNNRVFKAFEGGHYE